MADLDEDGLFPVFHVKGQMAVDGLEVGVIASNNRGANASGGERNQDVKREFAEFLAVEVVPASDGPEQLSSFQPVLRGWRQNLTAPGKIMHEPLFEVLMCAAD